MEILPLLQSRAIPTDVVLSNIYYHLCKIKSPLSNDLKTAIVNDHFKFKKIVMSYYKDSLYSRKQDDDNYFLIWLENDLINVLNDHCPLSDGLSENLKKEFPSVNMKDIVDQSIKLNEKVYNLWNMMTPEKKKIMYVVYKRFDFF